MASTTEIPPNPPADDLDDIRPEKRGVGAPEFRGRKKRAPVDEEEFHFLISELEDENSRGRLREALWISIIVHLVVIFTIREGPKLAPAWFAKQPHLLTTPELMKQRELTFTELPPDAQKPPRRPDTNKISDKDRIATSRAPEISKRALDAVRDNRRTGAPNAGPTPQPAQPQAQQQPAQSPPQQPGGQPQRQADEQIAKMSIPAAKPNFNIGQSPGSLIEQAARASASNRSGGVGGDLGGGPGTRAPHVGNLDILSDTMGVDFGPYLQRVLQAVRTNWYAIIPEVAQSPLRKKGNVAIEFIITKNGVVAGMRLVGPSGDVALDRAAWGGITGSNPFPPLPTEFRGENLALRFRFYYNPSKNEMQ